MKILHVFTIIDTPSAFFDGQFLYLTQNGENIHLATDSAEDIEFSNRNNITYHQISIKRKISPLRDLMTIKDLALLIWREKFDIVVGHTPKGAMVAMMASALIGVKKRVYFRHGLIYTTATGFKKSVLKLVEKVTGRLATKIINVSPSLSALAIKDHLNKDNKQYVIGVGTCGGIDTIKLFSPEAINLKKLSLLKKEIRISSEDFIIGFCGRLCRDKGVIPLVEAFQLFKQRNPAVSTKLLLIGGYDKRDTLPDYCLKTIQSDINIISCGLKPQKSLPYYYSLLDILAFPSYREGFGMSVIEASAMEVPVIVSRSHGCIDAIIENRTGLYIDIDPVDIAQKLEYLYKEKHLRIALGKGGREWVCQNFERTKLWPKHLEFYESL